MSYRVKRSHLFERAAILLAMVFGAQGATKILVSVPNPITPVADSTKALATTPYCSPVTVKNLTTGSTFSSIPAFSGCSEIPIIISPGLPRFPAGSAYVAYPDDSSGQTVIGSIPAGGSPVPSPIGTIAGRFDHVNLVFDTSGAYGGGLLILTESGDLYSLSTGLAPSTPKKLGTVNAGVALHAESPAFAPASFGPLGGLLWFINEGGDEVGNNTIYAVSPSTLAAHAVIAVPAGSDRAESLAFVSPGTCSVPVPGQLGASANLLDALFSLNYVAFYSAPATFGYVGIEFNGNLLQLTSSGGTYAFAATPYDSGLGQQEHLNAVVCLPSFSTGRWTGGGSVFETDGTRVTHGLELHCDVNALPNNLEINWGPGNRFHLDTLVTAFCFFDPNVGSPRPPSAGFNTIVGTGTGSFDGLAGATISFTLTDAGEPGTRDRATFFIKNADGVTVLSVSGNLDKGNQQAHNQ